MLKDLYIGSPDAETEAKRKEFVDLFCDSNGKYKEFVDNPEKFLIVGRKGSGKTCIAHYACRQLSDEYTCKIANSQNFTIEKLAQRCSNEKNGDVIYALCKWFILKQLAKYIIELHPIKAIFPLSKYNKLKKIVDIKESDLLLYRGKSITVKKASNLSTDISNSVKKDTFNYIEDGAYFNKNISKGKEYVYEAERKGFFDFIDDLEELVIENLGSKDKIMVFFDDLDEIDKKLIDDPSNDIILNFIKIAKNYNNRQNNKIKIVLLIRTDILNKLQRYDGNLNKIKTSCSVELYWLNKTGVSPYEHPLMSMILHKLKTTNFSYKDISDKSLYNKLFPEKINGKEPLEYFLDFSFGRPRDLITYLNRIIEKYPGYEAFTAAAIKGALTEYTDDFYGEMQNETVFHKNPEYTQECFKLLYSINKNIFSYEDILKSYRNERTAYKSITDLNEALEFLFDIGAIGNKWKRGKDTCFGWSYRKDSLGEVDINKNFTIHYGIRKKF